MTPKTVFYWTIIKENVSSSIWSSWNLVKSHTSTKGKMLENMVAIDDEGRFQSEENCDIHIFHLLNIFKLLWNPRTFQRWITTNRNLSIFQKIPGPCEPWWQHQKIQKRFLLIMFITHKAVFYSKSVIHRYKASFTLKLTTSLFIRDVIDIH